MQYKIAQETIDALNSVKESDKNTFYVYIAKLRIWGWTLQDIAEAFLVSKSAVAQWEKNGIDSHGTCVGLFEGDYRDIKPVAARLTTTGPKREPADFPTTDAEQVAKLTYEARVVSKNTSPNAPSRKSAVLLEELLLKLNRQGISMARLASAAGVSRRAIAQRINKARIAEKIDT